MPVSRGVFTELLHYVHDRLGFRFTSANRQKLETKLRLMRLPDRWPDLEAFLLALTAGDQAAHDLLVKTITVNHTFFFREKAQLDALAAAARTHGNQNPSVWSAACSTGEEAYSIAILLLEQGLKNFRIVASDINPKVLHAVNQGIYHESRLEQVPRYLLLKYFLQEDDVHWKVIPDLRRYLAVKTVNLVDPVRFEPPFDYIVCRNVFIYFDEASRSQALATLRRNLKPGGLLFLGMTESLLDIPSGLERGSHASYRRTVSQDDRSDSWAK